MDAPSQNDSLISLFANALKQKPEKAITLADFLEGIEYGRWKTPVENVRALASTDREQYDMKKRRLPAGTLSVHCLSRESDLSPEAKAITHSGWLQADFDLKDNPILATPEDRARMRQQLLADPHVHSVFVGPSGEGLKAVVAIPANLERHKAAWFAADAHFRERHGLNLDKSTKDPMRLCFVSYDPDLATSDHFEPIQVAEEQRKISTPPTSSTALPPPTAEEIREALSFIPPRPDYDTWLKIASAVWSVLPLAEGARILNDWSPEEKEGEYAEKHKNRLKQVHIGTLFHIAKEHGYKTPTSKAGKVKTLPALSSLPKIYYAGKGGYAIEHHGKYIPLSSSDAVKEHLSPYLGPKGDYGGALCDIRLNNYVSYIGPVAGHRPGIHTAPDMDTPFLVTTGPKIIQGAPGDFPFIDGFLTDLLGQEQIPSFIGWCRQAVRNLMAGKRRPLPAAALVGPKGCGKSLAIELVRLLLGGRSSNALKALNGAATFNIDTLGTELLAIDDDIASGHHAARVALAQGIKRQLFAASVRVEGKFRDVITMRPIHAVMLSVNSEPEHMRVLPAMDDSLMDKISLFQCSRARLEGLQDPQEIGERLNAEIPAFIHYLENTSHPEELCDRRTGIAAWHHPAVLQKLKDMEIEECFRELLFNCHAVTSAIEHAGYWSGSALELQQLLMDDDRTRHGARNILNYASACGTYLGNLAAAGTRISSKIVRGQTKWKIESLSKGGGVDHV